MSKQPKRLYEFGPFQIDTVNRLLLRDGEPVTLKAKAVETLLVLIESNGEVLEKDDLMKTLWPDSFVEEANLTQNIYMLRKALGENEYIETVPRRGYRFTAVVKKREHASSELVLREQTRTSLLIEEEEETSTDAGTEDVRGNRLLARASLRRTQVLTASLVLIALAVGTSYYIWRGKQDSISSIKSIAVLPFKLAGPVRMNTGDEYLGLGMADALITKLSRFGQ